MLTALQQAFTEQQNIIRQWRHKTDAAIAEEKVQAVTAVYDALKIRQQTEQ